MRRIINTALSLADVLGCGIVRLDIQTVIKEDTLPEYVGFVTMRDLSGYTKYTIRMDGTFEEYEDSDSETDYDMH